MEDIALVSLETRLARAMLRLAGEGDTITATHEVLARETGSGRAAISRQLGQMVRMGWVTQERGGLHVTDRPAVEALAELAW